MVEEQPYQEISTAIESFLTKHARAVLLEDGKVLFDFAEAKYSLQQHGNRCTMQVWSGTATLPEES